VFNWLHGAVPGGKECYHLAKFFGCTMEWLFESFAPESISYTEMDSISAGSALASWPESKIKSYLDQLGLSPKQFEGICDAMESGDALRWLESAKDYYKKLDENDENRNSARVNTEMQALLQKLRRLTDQTGKKAELARFLRVSQSRVFDWLSGKCEPGGQNTLKLLQLVEEQEGKK
jgi:DNA-binding transcriptional regulator YiaG